jgi:hypothetical protein
MFNVVLHSSLESDARPLFKADLSYGIAAGDAAHQ